MNIFKYKKLLLSIGILSVLNVMGQPITPTYGVGAPVNHVRTWVPVKAIGNPNEVVDKPITEVKEATQYFDGLGRLLQSVVKKGSMVTTNVSSVTADTVNAVDLVTPIQHDGFGREQYSFLSFASSSNNGRFKTDAYAQHANFMDAQYGSQGNDKNFGYSQTVFEASPLSRITESYAPGENWAGTTAQANENDHHSTKVKYWSNTAQDSVIIWDVINGANIGDWGSYTTTGAYYVPGELYKMVTTDEHNKQLIEFKNKEGQIILKKVQLTAHTDDGTGKGYDGWMCTYYIYDYLGALRCVVQPEGVKWLVAGSWQMTVTLLAEQCFRYEYDQRNRMVVKKVPEAEKVYMIYDLRDRLVMTQDAGQRSENKWVFIEYDNLNRPIRTGIIQKPQDSTFMVMRANAYNSVDYPVIPFGTLPLTKTFYDDYDWLLSSQNDIPSGLNANYDASWNGQLSPANPDQFPYAETNAKDTRTSGMITGSQVMILNSSPAIYMTTLTIYDNKARPIQVKQLNHTGGMDVVTTQYSWSGQPLLIVSKQQNGTLASITTITKNTYDALGRVTQTIKNVINNQTSLASGEKIQSQQYYDALGQLRTKKLGVSGSAALETQEYEYNIRGWLLGMNRGYVSSATAATAGYFGFDLSYDKPNNSSYTGSTANNPALNGYAGSGLFNGNIAGMSWRGQSNEAPIRRYEYAYDAANRLLKGDFKQHNGTGYATHTKFDFSMKMGDGINPASAYDGNGNIKKMWHRGLPNGGSTATVIDNLTYTYQAGSNKLLKVQDAQTTNYQLGDFHDGTNGVNNDYTYDVNGNLTQDKNKSISAISYNFLNLPEQITVTGKGTITYLYDAAGNKLKKTVNESGQPQKVTTYLGGMIFENEVLQHIATEEGRARVESGAWKFDYFLKDHLGNVRIMLADNGTVLEENHYYPFGLVQRGISYQNTSIAANKFKYNGKEEQRELGLEWLDYGARFYDNQIGRWHVVDPLATKYFNSSSYSYVLNNPLKYIDPDGKDVGVAITRDPKGGGTIVYSSTVYVSGNNASGIVASSQKAFDSWKNNNGTYTDPKGNKWNVSIQMTFKVATENDVNRIKNAGAEQYGDNLLVSDLPEGGRAYAGMQGANYIKTRAGKFSGSGNQGRITSKSGGRTVIHENLHMNGLGDRYSDVTYEMTENGESLGRTESNSYDHVGFEGDMMAGGWDMNQVHFDNLGSSALGVSKEKGSDNFIMGRVVDDANTKQVDKIEQNFKSGNTEYSDPRYKRIQ